MNKKYKLAGVILLLAVVGFLAARYIGHHNIAVLSPKGVIARQQRQLIITATLLMLIVVIPVFILTFWITYRFREGNKTAQYTPDWDHHTTLEIIWWAIPGAIISMLAIITWHSSHQLDPFRALNSNVKPVRVQVVALQWKWLFIYPEQNIASVNFFQVPVNTPINFEITSDAPMNSFWIPQLGGQIYAMSGMSTHLHLMADTSGSYRGSSANISGRGFAGMKFIAKASSRADFDMWVDSVKQAPQQLSMSSYNQLASPSVDNPPAYYSQPASGLYDYVVMKYMMPGMDSEIAGHVHADGGVQ